MVSAALNRHQRHPVLEERQDALLRSINDRLGALCAAAKVESGEDISPLTDDWMLDCFQACLDEKEILDEINEEFELDHPGL